VSVSRAGRRLGNQGWFGCRGLPLPVSEIHYKGLIVEDQGEEDTVTSERRT